MRTADMINLLNYKEFLDKLYGFAYKRCSTSHEAEDLCSDIILAIVKSIRKGQDIDNFYAYAWTIAHRIYADYCENRKKQSDRFTADGYIDEISNIQIDPINEYIDSEADKLIIKQIKTQIAFLSKIYRDVMVMYYLDEMKISTIAKVLSITETTVKQRLFYARKIIKKEVENMDNKDLSLKPMSITFWGTGNPSGNDPRGKAERILSQNIVYLCKHTARSVDEISELLNVPTLFVEDELNIQCHGENGHYGLLRKLDNGKYISNVIIVAQKDLKLIYNMYKQEVDSIVDRIAVYFETNKEKILNFPFLNKQKDLKFIAWSLITQMIWAYKDQLKQILKDKYFSDIEILKREFSTFGITDRQGERFELGFYGCDGNVALNVCGYSKIHYANIYGSRIERHFSCGHNLNNDMELFMTVKAIKGIPIDTLSDEEKEIAAKAIKSGYIKKDDDMLYPKILVLDEKDKEAFYNLAYDFGKENKDLCDNVANKVHEFVKKLVPKHLMNEYDQLVLQSLSGLQHEVVEKCIEKGILNVPESSPCGEGTWMIVTE